MLGFVFISLEKSHYMFCTNGSSQGPSLILPANAPEVHHKRVPDGVLMCEF